VCDACVCSRHVDPSYDMQRRKSDRRWSRTSESLFAAVIFVVFDVVRFVGDSVSPRHSFPLSDRPQSIVDQMAILLSRLLVLREYDEMLLPDPSQSIRIVVLVLGKPQLTLLRNDVKDFALHIGKVRIAAFLARFVDIELEERGAHKQDNSGVCSRHTGAVAGR
jgi:hypothetical protein